MSLQPHQQRVIDEKADLDDRLSRLIPFIVSSDIFNKLPEAEKVRMGRQAILMEELSKVLGERIAAFGEQNALRND